MKSRSLAIATAVVALSSVVGMAASASPVAGPARTSTTVKTTALPASPVITSTVSGNRLVTLSWTESTTGAVVFRASATSSGLTTRTCKVSVDTCKIKALQNGAIYALSVTATNKGGTSAPSTAVTAVAGVPMPPQAVRAKAAKAAAVVAWAPPVASGVPAITEYTATASPGGATCSTFATLLTKPAKTCRISGLTSSDTYSISVTATNEFGTSAASAPATVTAK